ncbi:hypothetical protein ACRALDRAFT_1077052 [Sodiomyces alcalophilus JCM 7366]|uniref:uncharacterized protein n=1 Tax=Sodiomyces alcalophilus JCM 7366 TaxID=591952 RepID=UPI0039B608FC
MSKPLDGCTVALGAKFPWDVAAYVQSLGAAISLRFAKKTTHVITTDNDFATNAKVRQAQTRGDCHIVGVEWAHESERTGSKADEAKFVVDGKGTSDGSLPTQATGSANGSAVAQPASVAGNTAPVDGNGASTSARRSTRKRAAPVADQATDQDDEKTNSVSQPSKKKKATKCEANEEEKKKVKEEVCDGQTAKSKDIIIPLDEGINLPNAKVYIDPSGIIYDAALNQTNAGRNNNKFYRIQLLQTGSAYKTWTRWGRVGEFGQSSLLGKGDLANALSVFEKKFKDKTGRRWDDRAENPIPNKYAFIEKNYDPDSDAESDAGDVKAEVKDEDAEPEPECTLEPEVQDLLALIFNQQYFAAAMTQLNYDANKLPLGKLSKSTITRGFQALKDLSELFDDPSLAQSKYNTDVGSATEMLSNLFYTLIPHDFGRQRPPVIRSSPMLKKELELLESLSDMKAASDIMKPDRKKTASSDTMHPLDRQFQALGLDELTALDPESKEFWQLKRYFTETKGSTHYITYKDVEQIFRVERAGERKRFEEHEKDMTTRPGLAAKTERLLLWHGSRATNYGGILSQGLRIAPPEAPVTGYMFGKGIYLADMSSKSVNYCVPSLSDNTALLLLCEAEVGDPMQQLIHANGSAGDEAKRKGLLATWGQGRMGPREWRDASCVHPSLEGVKMPDVSVEPGDTNVAGAGLWYNEYIVYNVSQVRLRYLLRVKIS